MPAILSPFGSGGAASTLKQFNVSTYGAVGNGQMQVDGAVSTSTPTTLTCATSTPFKSTDVGKYVIVNGTGGTGTAGVGIITGFTSSSVVTVTWNTPTPTATVSGACVLWGTDDTAAFQSAINAATTYMNTSGLSAQVYKPAAPAGIFHMIGGPLVTTGTANGQLVIPTVYTVGTPQQTLYFYADITRSLPLWTQTAWAQVSNAVVSAATPFTSTSAYTTNAASFGKAGVISSTPSQVSLVAPILGLPAFQNIHVVFQNWTIVTPSNANGWQLSAFQMGGSSKCEYQDCAALISTNYNATSGANQFPAAGTLPNGLATGFILPGNGNNDDCIAYNPTASGYAFGLSCSEHAVVIGGREILCWAGFLITGNDGESSSHDVNIFGNSMEQCPTGFWVVGAGSAGFTLNAQIDLESMTNLILDNNTGAGLASLGGDIRVSGQYTVAQLQPQYPTLIKIKGVASNTVPGWVFGYTGFTTAGTTVAVQNPYARDATVYVTGGTVTAVTAGVSLGGTGGSAGTHPTMTAVGFAATGFSVEWPSMGWLALTFSVAPTVNIQVF